MRKFLLGSSGSRRQQLRGQQDALSSYPEPRENECVMRVARPQGANLYELENGSGTLGLYSLPKALRHVVLMRKGSYVIARDDDEVRGKVKGEIVHVLLEHHIDHLKKTPHWPQAFHKNGKSHSFSQNRAGGADADLQRGWWSSNYQDGSGSGSDSNLSKPSSEDSNRVESSVESSNSSQSSSSQSSVSDYDSN
mmetsp:Transcript_20/g.56  ORF Transcript_20/g.56 Transcript_20/m.56 type:complete len:194 (+) Transcript_20:102-683(+)